jgi:hypothetical protein
MLSPQQHAFFQTFGYLSFPGLVADRIAAIQREFEVTWAGQGGGHAGKPHDHRQRSCIGGFIDLNASLSTLLDDERVLGIAHDLVGEDFNYMGSDGNFYVGDTQWHSDGWHTELLHIKLAFYLDPLTRDTGALRVIPGSHLVGDAYAEALTRRMGEFGVAGKDIPAVALETVPGDVVLFNHNTKHASFGGDTRRRMFTMNLCQRYPERMLPELRNYLTGAARFWVEEPYWGPTAPMIGTASPARMRHLQQVLDNFSHVPELSRQARATMLEPARG